MRGIPIPPRPRVLRLLLFFQRSRLSVSDVIEFRPANCMCSDELQFADNRRMDREDAFHGNTLGDLPHAKCSGWAIPMATSDNQALKNLEPGFFAFFNFLVDADSHSGSDIFRWQVGHTKKIMMSPLTLPERPKKVNPVPQCEDYKLRNKVLSAARNETYSRCRICAIVVRGQHRPFTYETRARYCARSLGKGASKLFRDPSRASKARSRA